MTRTDCTDCDGMAVVLIRVKGEDVARPCRRCNLAAFQKWKAGEYRGSRSRAEKDPRPPLQAVKP